jgi:hypothetical protein
VNIIHVGIDPGKAGGIAVLYPTGGVDLYPLGQYQSLPEMWTLLRNIGSLREVRTYNRVCVCHIERVGGYVGRSGGQPGSAMFNFGKGYGMLLMALTAAGLPFTEVVPHTWQKGLGLEVKGDRTTTEWKAYLADHARKLYPGLKITKAVADALLIAHYGRMATAERRGKTKRG